MKKKKTESKVILVRVLCIVLAVLLGLVSVLAAIFEHVH